MELLVWIAAIVVMNVWSFHLARKGQWLTPRQVAILLKACRDVEDEHGLARGSCKVGKAEQ